jgi:NMD protein affecting ribosome stability and mRNA decay
MLTGLYIEMAPTLQESAICWKCGHEEESSYHVLCQFPSLARHNMEIFGSAWLELTVSRKASLKEFWL